ncbi:hypothetical protein COO60DRAFT_1697955 [Scenedesmus sp. NREL 46B-D3]|nr:hypothetical protein COO60DRAFT_1697955 [Scenedesmus sp. NREL 46B-D3]
MNLSAHAVLTWLQRHPAVASGTSRLLLDLGHHSYHDFDRQNLEQLLAALPQLTSVCLVGSVDGTDAYEPLGRLRCLRQLELCCASQACLEGGLLALGFLPRLASLSVSLDIHPASPCCLSELPSGLASLSLGSMWLEGLPQQLRELTDLTSVTLERCQLEANPLPLLLTLPQLAAVTIRNASRPTPSSSDACQLLPMTQPQQQLAQLQEAAAAAVAAGSTGQRSSSSSAGGGRRGLGSRLRGLRGAAAASHAAAAGSNLPSSLLSNTSITCLSLVDVGLHQLPGCVSQLVALQDLNLGLNYDMGLNPGACLPAELAHLQLLQGLCLGHCSLGQLPPVLAFLTGLTRLGLQGNALSAPGFGPQLSPDTVPAFRHSLRVLDLGGQGSSRGGMRGIPSWVGSCTGLHELRLGCHCLAYCGSSHARGELGDGSLHAVSFGSAAAAAIAGQALDGAAAAAAGSGSPGASARYHFTYSYSPSGSSSSLARGSAGLSAAAAGQPSSGTGAAAAECWLGLQQLPGLLPQLRVLCVEGGMWEHRAVREALTLVRQLERQGSKLQVVLPL